MISSETAKDSALGMGAFGVLLTLVCFGFLFKMLYQFWMRKRGPRSASEIVSLIIKVLLPVAPLARSIGCFVFAKTLLISPVEDQVCFIIIIII